MITDSQEVEKTKRKRRSNAEVAAEKAAIAAAKAERELAKSEVPIVVAEVDTLPPSGPVKVNPIDAIAILAANDIDPCAYSDLYTLMKDCLAIMKEYNLSDTKFIELMHRFDTDSKKRGRR
jgi:molecular chaperone DnaK (HSP70)